MPNVRGWRGSEQQLALDGGSTELDSPAVLIADDDDMFRETLTIWLADGQWEVQEAANGREALEQLDDTIDILVLDRRMPEMTGPEVVEHLEETSFSGTTIVLSAYKPDTHLNGDDVTEYITKPIERNSFISRLKQSVR